MKIKEIDKMKDNPVKEIKRRVNKMFSEIDECSEINFSADSLVINGQHSIIGEIKTLNYVARINISKRI